MKFSTLGCFVVCLVSTMPICSADVLKANNSTSLSSSASWSGNVLPTDADVAVWDTPYSINPSLSSTLGGNLTFAGIRVGSPTTTPRIRNTAGAVLTLKGSGIDMATGVGNFDVYAALKIGANQSWNIATGRTLTIQGELQGSGVQLSKTGAGNLVVSSTSLLYPGQLAIQSGAVQVNSISGTQEFSGALSGSGALSKSGAGMLTLSGDNSSFSGGMTLSAGTLNLNHPSALGSGVFVISGGSLDQSSGSPVTLDGAAPVAWNSDFTYAGASSSSLNLGASVVSVNGSRNLTISSGTLSIGANGSITGGASAAFTKLGSGTLEVKPDATIDLEGKIAVSAGTLRLQGGTVSCGATAGNLEISGAGVVELNGGVLRVRSVTRTAATATFRFNGGTLAPRTDSTTFMSGLDQVTVGAGGAMLKNDGWYVTLSQPLLHDPSLGSTPDGGLTVSDDFGSGLITLQGACTYTGPTVIQSGTLILGNNASIANSSSIEVKSGAYLDVISAKTLAAGQTLKGNGIVLGFLTVGAGATISPGGETLDSLFMTDVLSIGGTASFQIQKSGSSLSSDRIEGLLEVRYGGTLQVIATGSTLAAGDSFKLFEALSYSGGFTSMNLPPLPAGLYWETSRLLVDGTIEVIHSLPTPLLNPAGGAYLGSRTVTISGVSGAAIHYTTDGSDPWTSSTTVVAASPVTGIVIPENSVDFTIKACQSRSGDTNSEIATAVYLILDAGTWNYVGAGNWSDASKWLYGVVPQGVGIGADFSALSLYTSPTVTVDGARTIGELKFGDLAQAFSWTLTGSALTLDNGAETPVIRVSSNTATITAPLIGTQGFVKSGPGALVAQLGNAQLSGNVIIGEGNVSVDRTSSLGVGTLVLGSAMTGASEAGLLQRGSDIWPPATDFGCANAVEVAAGPTGRLVIGRQNAGNYAANFTGTITLHNNVIFRNNGADRLAIEGKITGTGNVTVEGGRVNWSSPSNDFVGEVTVASGGLLQTNAATTIPAQSKVTVNGSLGTNSATGETLAIGSLNGTGTIYRLAASNPTLAIGGNGQNGNFQGVIQNDFPVIKTGAGTQIFSGASTYTGGTTVNAGTLLIHNTSGSGTGTGTVAVNGTSSLGGAGSVTGAVTVASTASLVPGGDSVGNFSTGGLILAGNYRCQLGGGSADRVSVTGNLNLTGAALVVSTLEGALPGTYVIASYTGTLTGTFASVTSGYTVDYSTPNQVKLVVSGNAYDSWIASFGLSGMNSGATADPDHDGLANVLEFVLGGNPAAVQDQALLPKLDLITNPGGTVPNGNYMRFTYRRTTASAYLNPEAQIDADLTGAWSSVNGMSGVVQVVTPGFYNSPVAADRVEVFVPRAGNELNGRLFGRLRVVVP